jgi:hypothetical protein
VWREVAEGSLSGDILLGPDRVRVAAGAEQGFQPDGMIWLALERKPLLPGFADGE